MKNIQSRIAAVVTCLSIGIILFGHFDQARAVGFRLPNQDPEGISRGNAFAATADNPSAIYYNPAGISQLDGTQIRAGLYLISADTWFSGPSGKGETDTAIQPVPQFYCVKSLENVPLSFGLGVYAPYGLGLDWGTQNPFRTAAQDGKLLYACANPVVSWKVLPSLSLAIGPTLNYARAELEQGLTPINPNDHFHFKGSGFDAGFNAGLLWKPHEMWAIGVNYRSATTIDFEGHVNTKPNTPFPPYFSDTRSHASVQFPQFVAGGVSFRPNTNWNFEVDLDWTDWDNVNQIVFKNTPLGNIPFILNYKSGVMYEFGMTRQLGAGYFLNLGFIYSENSSPTRYFNPIVPDSDLYLPGIGLGHRGQHWDWAVGYHCGIGPGRDISNNINPTVNGTYKTFNNAFNISATYKF